MIQKLNLEKMAIFFMKRNMGEKPGVLWQKYLPEISRSALYNALKKKIYKPTIKYIITIKNKKIVYVLEILHIEDLKINETVKSNIYSIDNGFLSIDDFYNSLNEKEVVEEYINFLIQKHENENIPIIVAF